MIIRADEWCGFFYSGFDQQKQNKNPLKHYSTKWQLSQVVIDKIITFFFTIIILAIVDDLSEGALFMIIFFKLINILKVYVFD